jgi:subtilisin family serine protease
MFKVSLPSLRKSLTLLFICLIGIAYGQIDPGVYPLYQANKTVSVLVYMKDQVDLSNAINFHTKEEKTNYVYQKLRVNAEKTQTPIIKYLNSKSVTYQAYTVVNLVKVEADYETFTWLTNRKEVKSISYDQPMPMLEVREDRPLPSNRAQEVSWGVKNIGADSLWSLGVRGQGAIVGGQDTGYGWELNAIAKSYRGKAASGAVDHNYNWHDAIRVKSPLNSDDKNPCGYDLKTPCDDDNHGTHTMGTMVGEDSLNAFGVAPLAQWIGCRNMERGWGAPSTYIECFEWFLAPTDLNGKNPDPNKAPDVINNSWGCPEKEGCYPFNFPIMETVIKNLKAAGVFVVVSAGNDGPSCNSVANPAAIFEASFSVGAHNVSNAIAGFSSRGGVKIDSSYRVKPNVSAPGVSVKSITKNGSYASYSGTSMAGPHVAGAVALLVSARPQLRGQVDVLENLLEQSAIKTNADKICDSVAINQTPNNTFGYGRINVLKAYELALKLILTNENIPQEEVYFYPNPASDEIIFHGVSINDGSTLSVFNTNGALVLSHLINQNYLLIGDLHNGVYQVLIKTKGKVFARKLVVLK